MADSYAPRLIEELKTHGVKDWQIDTTGKHNKLRFEWNGRTMLHVFPKTPSDHCGMLNSISSLRRELGVRRIICKSKNKRRKTKSVASTPMPVTISTRPDPFAALGKFKEKRVCPVMTLAQMAEMLYGKPSNV